ncbi:MAG: hypothetical protein HQL69_16640 [Magnetococcales bacterium]|nr:hypothetical protein [Magnetococcales bacterium]
MNQSKSVIGGLIGNKDPEPDQTTSIQFNVEGLPNMKHSGAQNLLIAISDLVNRFHPGATVHFSKDLLSSFLSEKMRKAGDFFYPVEDTDHYGSIITTVEVDSKSVERLAKQMVRQMRSKKAVAINFYRRN